MMSRLSLAVTQQGLWRAFAGMTQLISSWAWDSRAFHLATVSPGYFPLTSLQTRLLRVPGNVSDTAHPVNDCLSCPNRYVELLPRARRFESPGGIKRDDALVAYFQFHRTFRRISLAKLLIASEKCPGVIDVRL